jgi:hypothetical protein
MSIGGYEDTYWEDQARELQRQRDELAEYLETLAADPRLLCPLDGPGSHRQDLIELEAQRAKVAKLEEENRTHRLAEHAGASCMMLAKQLVAVEEKLANTKAVMEHYAEHCVDSYEEVRRLRISIQNIMDCLANGEPEEAYACAVNALDSDRMPQRETIFVKLQEKP